MIDVKYAFDTEHNVYVAYACYQAGVKQTFMTEAGTITTLHNHIQECLELSFDELDIQVPPYSLEELTITDFRATIDNTITQLTQ